MNLKIDLKMVVKMVVAITLMQVASASASVGKVMFTYGVVTVETPISIKLKKGDTIDAGNVIVTGSKGMAQLKLDDDTKIIIRPGSRFVVESLEMPAEANAPAIGAGKVLRASFTLQKGGFRTITGRISKRDPTVYRVATPSAVIGVRGTNYTARLCAADCGGGGAADGLYIGVSQGGATMTNAGGQLDLGKNEYGYAANFNTSPTPLISPPQSLRDGGLNNLEEDPEEDQEEEESAPMTAAAEDDETETKDDEGDDGGDEEATVAASGEDEGEVAATESAEGEDEVAATESAEGEGEVAATESAEGEGEVAATGSAEGESEVAATGSAEGEGEVAATRSAEGESVVEPTGSAEGEGEIVATVSAEGERVVGTTESPASTSSDGEATSSPSGAGDSGGSTESIARTVAGEGNSSLELSAEFGTVSSVDTSQQGTTNPSTASTASTSPDAGATESTIAVAPPTAAGAAPAPAPATPVQEIEAVSTTGTDVDLTGGASVTTPRGLAFALSPTATSLTSVSETMAFSAAGNLTAFDDTRAVAKTTYRIGTAKNLNTGEDSANSLKWGRWAQGTATTQATGATTTTPVDLANRSLHWLVGPEDLSTQQVITGAASYVLSGNTDPTNNQGQTGILGSATLSANFTAGTVASNVQLGIADQVWKANGTGTINATLFNGLYNTVRVNGALGGTGSFGGRFTNVVDGAPQGAGLTYSLVNGARSVSGVAIFKKQ
jgi:hypothetical protein